MPDSQLTPRYSSEWNFGHIIQVGAVILTGLVGFYSLRSGDAETIHATKFQTGLNTQRIDALAAEVRDIRADEKAFITEMRTNTAALAAQIAEIRLLVASGGKGKQ